jgi:hypothetical protein
MAPVGLAKSTSCGASSSSMQPWMPAKAGLPERSPPKKEQFPRGALQQARDDRCQICLEVDPNILTLCCGSTYHVGCVAQWLQKPVAEPTCPVCRLRLLPPSTSSALAPGTCATSAQRCPSAVHSAPTSENMGFVQHRVAHSYQPLGQRQCGAASGAAEARGFTIQGRRVLADVTNTLPTRPVIAEHRGGGSTAALQEQRRDSAGAPAVGAPLLRRRAADSLRAQQQMGSPSPQSPHPWSPTFASPQPSAQRGSSVTPEPVPMPQTATHRMQRLGRGPTGCGGSPVGCSKSHVPLR